MSAVDESTAALGTRDAGDARPRRILIVGGVAAGMSAAARARRLDEHAEIIVLERGEHVSFANCGLPYYVSGEIGDESALLVQTPESLRAVLNLDVRPRHEVIGLDPAAREVVVRTPAGDEVLTYDELLLAPGTIAVRPEIPGIDSVRVGTLRTVGDAVALRELVESEFPADGVRRAVVLGAGFIGVEAAEALRARALEVELVQRGPHVLAPLEPEIAAPVAAELARIGVRVRTGVEAVGIEPGVERDTVLLSDGARLPADTILLAAGARPDTAVFEAAGILCEDGAIVVDERGRTSAPHVSAAGDAVRSTDPVTGIRRSVLLAGPANRAGRQIADHLLRPELARPIPAPLGTAVIRVGSLTAALTGANRRALDRAGIDFATLHLHPNQHAGYFPGAAQMSLLVHVRRGDGLVLGAQGVGPDGIDKRIDVLATAIRAGLTAGDLVDLDLAYSPVHGSAKDPVNLAGMVGSNVVDGTLELWYAEHWAELRDGALVLDVRSPGEFAAGHLPGALNVPHTELRERLGEVRAAAADRPVLALCGSGVRSHIAHRLLAQEGFDSASLSGGMLTARAVLGDALLVRS